MKRLKIEHTEHGYDFLTFYFLKHEDALEAGRRVYRYLKKQEWEKLDINHIDFVHKPGDPDHFHTDGPIHEHWETAYKHFHIVIGHKPTQTRS